MKPIYAILSLHLLGTGFAQGLVGSDLSFAKTDFCRKYGCYLVTTIKGEEYAYNYKEYIYKLKHKNGIQVTNLWTNGQIMNQSKISISPTVSNPETFLYDYVFLMTGKLIDSKFLDKCFLDEKSTLVKGNRDVEVYIKCTYKGNFYITINAFGDI